MKVGLRSKAFCFSASIGSVVSRPIWRLACLCLVLACSTVLSAQPEYNPFPTDEFRSPLGIPLVLSGTFGELRNNHFHAGLDIKTNGREGYKIYAAAEGYVARVKVQAGGYGQAIYIAHPNGYTSVYAHLKRFNDEIAAYVEREQYAREAFAVDLYPAPGELTIEQGEVIALSGNSGSSGGPHLHFEIRETASEIPINPLLFGFDIPDARKPRLRRVGVVAFDESGRMSENTIYLSPEQKDDLILVNADRVAFLLDSYDQLDGAANKNGVFRIEMRCDERPVFNFTADEISFAETRYINSLIHQPTYCSARRREYRCFREPGNRLSAYDRLENDGLIDLTDDEPHIIEFEISDVAGNVTHQYAVVQRSEEAGARSFDFDSQGNRQLYWGSPNYYEEGAFSLDMPWDALYSDLSLDHVIEPGETTASDVHQLYPDCYPLHQAAEVGIRPSSDDDVEKMVIVRVDSRGRRRGLPTSYTAGQLTAKTKELGRFYVDWDREAPKLSQARSYSKLKAGQSIVFTVSDDLSGLDRYAAYIDGQWVLLRYDAKSGRLTHTLDGTRTPKGKHAFRIVATDGAGNERVRTFDFVLE